MSVFMTRRPMENGGIRPMDKDTFHWAIII